MSTASDMVAMYITAEKKVLGGQSYTINGRSLSRANLNEIREGRREWEAVVRQETAKSKGGSSMVSLADFR